MEWHGIAAVLESRAVRDYADRAVERATERTEWVMLGIDGLAHRVAASIVQDAAPALGEVSDDVTDTLSAEFDAVIRVLAFGHRKHAAKLAESGYGDAVEHASHAQGHLTSAACLRRDAETGESHYAHAAARCILAAHCEALARTAAHPLPSAPEGEVPD